MSYSMTADGGRTDTERFTDDVDATALIEGDRISTDLVARHHDQLGAPIQRTPPEADEQNPDTRLVTITQMDNMNDVHSAILADPETGTMVRASRHDSNQAWSQAEADWTVREVGTSVVVEDVHELTLASNDDPVDDEHEYVQGWVEILLEEAANGATDYDDERELDGTTLKLRDIDGRKAMATITLED